MRRLVPTCGYTLLFLRRAVLAAGRRASLVSLAISALTLSTWGCGSPSVRSRAPVEELEPPTLFALAPEGADAALLMRVEPLVASPYFALLAASLRQDREPAALAESEWILDLAGRTDEIVALGWLGADDSLETLVLLRGRYDDEDARRMTTGEQGVREERYRRGRMFVRGDRALGIFGTHIIAVGPTRRVRETIARVDFQRARPDHDAVAALSEMARRSSSEVLLVVRTRPPMIELLGAVARARGEGDLRSIALDADVEAGLRARVDLVAESAEAATRLRSVVAERIAALGETALVEVLGLGAAIREIRPESEGRSVVARASIDDESLRAAITAALELADELERVPREGTPAP